MPHGERQERAVSLHGRSMQTSLSCCRADRSGERLVLAGQIMIVLYPSSFNNASVEVGA